MNPSSSSSSPAALWAGRIATGLSALFMLFDGAVKVIQPDFVVKSTAQTGFPLGALFPLGVIVVLAAVLYLIPRTAAWGALVLTGYLGGAVCANVQLHSALFSGTLFPVYFGVLIWLGLGLRRPDIRAIFLSPAA
ncbi:MAG TPA: DoxX family protein [Opitutaceae bacterium]|nr:DoxX family protein [Opitutaceae bacterium]